MSKKDNIYLIGAASYEDTVEQRLTLYNYIRQLAFLHLHTGIRSGTDCLGF